MHYVQYFIRGCNTGDLIEGCGDRAVFILDGRNSLATMLNDAHEANKSNGRHYPAYQIHRGSFSNSHPISKIIHTK